MLNEVVNFIQISRMNARGFRACRLSPGSFFGFVNNFAPLGQGKTRRYNHSCRIIRFGFSRADEGIPQTAKSTALFLLRQEVHE